MTESVYVLKKYVFYDSVTIVMISKDYTTIKRHFDKMKKETCHGYQITKYECDVMYDNFDLSYAGITDWIEIEYNGEIKNKIEEEKYGDVE